MEKALKLVGKNSSDIFMLRYPSTLIVFTEFDFSYFAESAINICNEALKTGEPDIDRIAELRRDIEGAHCYIEHNIRTLYDKIVYDCWIDYVCRRDNIGPSGLWNRFIRCKTTFEKIIFARLCEFRYNRAANEWLNIIRLKDYALTKMEFVFNSEVKDVEEAAARRNYFDLMFSVTARELGCRIEDLGVTKVFSVGRVPPAPFMFPNISKEIVRHALAGFDYSDDYSDIGDYSEISDQIAMDAFSRMKAGLAQEHQGFNAARGKMEKYSDKIFMPCSLKAAIDLEIDAIIEDGAWLARCKKCGRFFLRDKDHQEEYCSRFIPNGKTCLEQYVEEHPAPTMTDELAARCREVTDEIYSRVDKTMSTKEYEYWYSYLQAMIEKVGNGEIAPSELENFLNYSLEVDISRSHPIQQVKKPEPEYPKERVVKPFVPERISRDSLSKPAVQEPSHEEEEERPNIRREQKDGFFTSPTVQRQKNERRQVSHIIRGGESLGDNRVQHPDPAGFRPFGAEFGVPAPNIPQQNAAVNDPAAEQYRPLPNVDFSEASKPVPEAPEVSKVIRESGQTAKPFDQPDFSFDFPKISDVEKSPAPQTFEENLREEIDLRRAEKLLEEQTRPAEEEQHKSVEMPHEEAVSTEEKPREEAPRVKVIRKNAAALSAYGRISGAPLTAAPLEEIESNRDNSLPDEKVNVENERPDTPKAPVQTRAPQIPETPDYDPFKDIGSIFDVLERSENNMGASSVDDNRYNKRNAAPQAAEAPREDTERSKPAPKRNRSREEEPVPEWEETKSAAPRTVTRESAPSGIWTEDRGLFPNTREKPDSSGEDSREQTEFEMLKEKKHSKSNKTQRLYDVIMREADDNPNFRKKR